MDPHNVVLAGLIGAGIQASRTPALHEHEGDAQGLRYLYRLIDLDQLQLDSGALPDLLLAAERMNFTGLNITFPCKQTIIPLLDELSPEARGIGAVNTVVLKEGKRIGHNTDCLGFAEGFRRGLPGVGVARVVQMGAGGAGAAVAHALLSEGTQLLSIFDVEIRRAQALADNLNQHFGAGRAVAGQDLPGALAVADGLVNTTPMGMKNCRARRCRWNCCAGNCGWRRSCTSRWRLNCCARPAPWDAGPWTAATWRCFRR